MNRREKTYLQILIRHLESRPSSGPEIAIQELKKLQSGKIYRGPMDPDWDTLTDIWRYEAELRCGDCGDII